VSFKNCSSSAIDEVLRDRGLIVGQSTIDLPHPDGSHQIARPLRTSFLSTAFGIGKKIAEGGGNSGVDYFSISDFILPVGYGVYV